MASPKGPLPVGLLVLGATIAIVVVLGVWGYAAGDEVVSTRQARIEAARRPAFCRDLGHAVGPFVGRVLDTSVVMSGPAVEPSDADLVNAAKAMGYWETQVDLVTDAPEELGRPLAVLVRASADAARHESAGPLRLPEVRSVVGQLVGWWDLRCT